MVLGVVSQKIRRTTVTTIVATSTPGCPHMAMARAAVEQAQAALDMAEIVLAETLVVSPIDGIVAERHQSVGALIGPASPIVTLVSGDVEMVLGVEESQLGQVKEGQKAQISVAAYPSEVFEARVALVGPVADPKSRTFQVKVKPQTNDGRLRQGMFAQVKIVTQEKEKAVLVPKDAVVTRAGQTSVLVLKGDTVEVRPVTVGVARARHAGSLGDLARDRWLMRYMADWRLPRPRNGAAASQPQSGVACRAAQPRLQPTPLPAVGARPAPRTGCG